MRYLSAGLIYVAAATVTALLLGIDGGGLHYGISLIALMVAAGASAAAFFYTPVANLRMRPLEADLPSYRGIWLLLIGFAFALFALRSFCWLIYYDGNDIRIQSPNNLGDLGLHITYIKTFANGVALWPDSPLYVASKLRYPAGIDLFNAIFANLGFDLRHQLVATGLIASLATFYAFYRWSGTFGIAGFLFNGGLIGYQIFRTGRFLDYQGGPTISWKSIALSMFVTQRGLLYAIPAGLVLLWQWRAKYGDDPQSGRERLPIWVEYILYATMPLFHVHTFLALNIVLVLLFFGKARSRKPLLQLVAASFLPATFFVWLITDHFHAGSVFEWHFGWTQRDGEFAMPFFTFWFTNFGVFLPLAIVLVGMVARGQGKQINTGTYEPSIDAIFLASAVIIFLITCLVKTAPWEWDNTKILIWAYFITLPVMWDQLIRYLPISLRASVCFILFLSGFVSLIGGLAAGREGYGFANRAEVDSVAVATRNLPVEARFAAFPTYNHPLLLNGRKVVCGYAGHLWTQGIDYTAIENRLNSLMRGEGDWMQTARDLHVRYLYWGDEEKTNYANSSRPWENKLPIVAKGGWGAIYDFGK
jgi:hypothetical protein